MRTLEFQLGELFTNLRRNGLLTVAAIVTVTASLAVFGVFYLIDRNLANMLDEQARKAQISAYLKPGLADADLARIRRDIERVDGVASVEYVSSEAGFERLKESLGSEVLDVLEGESRLPAKFNVRPTDPSVIEQVAKQLGGIAGVEEVEFGAAVVQKLNSLVPQFRRVGWALLGLLSLATSAIISNAIRLTIYARRREIRIMQLVGATNGFIQMPFLLEGLFHGVVGGVLAVVATSVLYNLLRDANLALNPWLRLIGFEELMPRFAIGLVLLGAVYGAGSSLLSMRNFLKEA